MKFMYKLWTWRKKLFLRAGIFTIFGFIPLIAMAQEAVITTGDLSKAINTVWVLVAATIVFFMQLGFAYLEAGFVQSKNASSIIMEGFIDTCITAIIFWAVGFGLMFGSGNAFFGTSFFFMKGLPAELSGISPWAFMFFQFAFASAASTIISGGLGERIEFEANLIYSVIVILLFYPIVGHWAWGPGGWLASMGFIDFAGSTVVHSVGGWATLAGILVVGPRISKYGIAKKEYKSHNIPFIALGTFVLWFGWFGFNGGSTLSAMDGDLISKIIVNSNLSASAGAIIAMFISWKLKKKPDIVASLNGALAGLVAITASCAYVSAESSMIIGCTAAFVMYFGTEFLESMRIDDAVGAIAVHGFCGVFGTLAVGLFHEKLGLFFGGGFTQFGVQFIGVITVATFVVGGMYIVFAVISKLFGLRVPKIGEDEGLDKYRHGITSYPEYVR